MAGVGRNRYGDWAVPTPSLATRAGEVIVRSRVYAAIQGIHVAVKEALEAGQTTSALKWLSDA